jgi:probable HAF family extracellular repeat protein
MVVLGTLGGTIGAAEAINDAGQVVGSSLDGDGNQRVFFWEDGVMTDIGTLGGSITRLPPTLPGWPLSDAGHIVGLSSTGGGELHSFVWHQGVMTDLGPVDARAVNAAGQVVGRSTVNVTPTSRAFLWQNGAFTDLGALGGTFSEAKRINNLGQIVGRSEISANSDALHTFLWQNGSGMMDIGTLTTAPAFDIPYDINDQGYITGRAQVSATEQRGFLWFNGVMTDLGNLGGTGIRTSQPLSVNASGQVVGSSLTTTNQNQAFVWRNGTMTALETLGGNLSRADEINDAGLIVGTSRDDGQVSHAVLWDGNDLIDFGPGFANSINESGWIAATQDLGGGASRAVLWRPGTSDELIDVVSDGVDALVATGALNGGQGNSLGAKLEAAARALAGGRVRAATNQLEAFLNQLQALVRSGRLTEAQAQPLIAAVETAIDRMI